MKLAIMQPYFFPYIGYFQLIAAADVFVVYDNVKYTKKGWVSRNRMLQNGKPVVFSLSLQGDSDHLDVCDRKLATDFKRDRLLNKIKGAYGRAPYFSQTFPLVEQIMGYQETNLFHFLHHSIVGICKHFGIATDIRVSSSISIDSALRSQDRVLALCEAVGANTYLNTIGGMKLYAKEAFREKDVELKFLLSKPFQYPQFNNEFVSSLSIIDVMMFNPIDAIRKSISDNYELI